MPVLTSGGEGPGWRSCALPYVAETYVACLLPSRLAIYHDVLPSDHVALSLCYYEQLMA